MKRTYILIISLFLLLITGCSDCDSDYDTVGVRIDDFALRTGIVINTNIPDISVCDSTYVTLQFNAQILIIIHHHIFLI